MTITCSDCEQTTRIYWQFKRQPVCADCCGMRDNQAMRKANEYKLYVFRDQVRNAAGTFNLPATILRGSGDNFPNVNHIQVVFDHSVWHGIQSWDNVDGAVLLRRTKKKYLNTGEEI